MHNSCICTGRRNSIERKSLIEFIESSSMIKNLSSSVFSQFSVFVDNKLIFQPSKVPCQSSTISNVCSTEAFNLQRSLNTLEFIDDTSCSLLYEISSWDTTSNSKVDFIFMDNYFLFWCQCSNLIEKSSVRVDFNRN